MNLTHTFNQLKKACEASPKPASKSTAAKSAGPTLLQCGGQAVRDLFVPGHQGDKARVRSQYQLMKKLGVHQAIDAQAHSQDAISQTGRVLKKVSAGTQEALTVAKDHWHEEARTAKGSYRALVGAAQGLQSGAQGAFSTAKGLTKLGVHTAEFGYRSLKGEVDFGDLLRKGGEGALTLAENGSRYVASGQLRNDAKSFAKGCRQHLGKVYNDPTLEVPKFLAGLAATAALAGGLTRVGAVGRSLLAGAEGGAVATVGQAARVTAVVESGESVAAPALVQLEKKAAQTAAAVAPEAAEGVGTVVPKGYGRPLAGKGTVYPRNYPRPTATPAASPAPAPAVPATRLAPPAAPAPVVSAPPVAPAPPLPVAPAAVELPASALPAPAVVKPFCLPSSNYAPVPRGYLQLTEPVESLLNLTV